MKAVLGEITRDVEGYVSTIAAARASSYSGELSRFQMISGHDSSASAKAGNVQRESHCAVGHAIKEAHNYLTIRMHEAKTLTPDKEQPPTPSASVTNIYNLHGHGSRLNINSNDSSVNVTTVTEGQFFTDLRKAISTGMGDSAQRVSMLTAVDDMERAAGSATFAAKYQRFIASAANHMTLLTPFILLLTQMLLSK